MRQNPARRAALIDAAIEVLASEGARGLTFRAVDTGAGVPGGTASNYFRNREDLFLQIGGRIYERLQPEPSVLTDNLSGPRTAEKLADVMREVVGRVAAYRTGFLALMELRLEATRRPALRAVLTRTIGDDLAFNLAAHAESGLPGDATTVRLLYFSLNWLILERLTLPDALPEEDVDALITEAVTRALPPGRRL
ncbi:TetR/AcrR family transcriptional regulator [Amycolatopsis suaedae]|uniref:TetR family transcriptional regulator n=1 Tax=Amycolatopsis suaedae TaxID=2510978 RepID=A0A4Q7J5U7_9PSEU|nr:TetR/AcrR family transcriptional regulator [Amycolatopsis suaedae]RZQ61693.1 TetR family transcriptional regulator [Amycolatopsis suaedae]